jgi:hypothetical protein
MPKVVIFTIDQDFCLTPVMCTFWVHFSYIFFSNQSLNLYEPHVGSIHLMIDLKKKRKNDVQRCAKDVKITFFFLPWVSTFYSYFMVILFDGGPPGPTQINPLKLVFPRVQEGQSTLKMNLRPAS